MRMVLPWRSAGSRGAHRDGVWEGQDGYPNRRVVPLCQWATADSPLHLALASELVAALKEISGYPLPPNPLDLASVLGGAITPATSPREPPLRTLYRSG